MTKDTGMDIVLTPVYAAAITALFIGLSVRVIVYRRGNRVSLGDAGSPELLARIRAQGNCAEYAPLGLLLLLIADLSGTPPVALHISGLLLVVGRLAHAYALAGKQRFAFRTMGMVLTFTSLGLSAMLTLF